MIMELETLPDYQSSTFFKTFCLGTLRCYLNSHNSPHVPNIRKRLKIRQKYTPTMKNYNKVDSVIPKSKFLSSFSHPVTTKSVNFDFQDHMILNSHSCRVTNRITNISDFVFKSKVLRSCNHVTTSL